MSREKWTRRAVLEKLASTYLDGEMAKAVACGDVFSLRRDALDALVAI